MIESSEFVKSYKKKHIVDNVNFVIKNGEDKDLYEFEKQGEDQVEKMPRRLGYAL